MDTRLPFNVFSVRFAFLSSPCILVLGFFLSGFWAGKSVEVTCRTHVLVNMSHIAKADGIRFFHLPLSNRVGPLKCILQLASDTLL